MPALPETLSTFPEIETVYQRIKPRLEANGIDYVAMAEVILGFCCASVTSKRANEIVAYEGPTIVSPKTGGSYTNPAVNVSLAATKEIRANGVLLGLVPRPANLSKAAAPPADASAGGPSSFLT